MARRRFYTDERGRVRPITSKRHFRGRSHGAVVLKSVAYQRGYTHKKADEKREALPPGERVSASGNVYWETRKNRSDKPGSRV